MCCSGLTCARAPSAPGWWRNKCSYSSIHSLWTRVNALSTFLSFIAVVVTYGEARMCIHQQKHILAEPCLFHVLFITNHIADALSDLSWTAVLAHAEPCVENPDVFFFSANHATPTRNEIPHISWHRLKVLLTQAWSQIYRSDPWNISIVLYKTTKVK